MAASLDATNRSAGPAVAPQGRPTVLLKRGDLTKEEEQALLQQKLQNASKQADIQQQKVAALAEMVDNMMSRKKRSMESLARLQREFAEKKAAHEKVQNLYNETEKRRDENQKKADRIYSIIKKSEMDFNRMIKDTQKNAKFTLNRTQATTGQLTVAELDAERGYSCHRSSSQTSQTASTGSLSKMAKRGMF